MFIFVKAVCTAQSTGCVSAAIPISGRPRYLCI